MSLRTGRRNSNQTYNINNPIIGIMARYKVRVRYAFEGTYTVAAGSCEEAKRVVEEDCGLVLGGNIHTTCNEEEVTDWNFGIHPESLILSIKETGRKARVKYTAMDFSDRIEELRNDIIEAIRQLLQAYSLTELAFTDREDDPVWIVWFGKNGDPYECRVTGVRITASSLTVIAEEKESGDEVECYGPFELGASNIDWLREIYEAAKLEFETPRHVKS